MFQPPTYLTLMLGPLVAAPAPQPYIEALQRAEVTHSDNGRSGFQLTFQIDRSGPAAMVEYPLLALPLLRQFTRVVLVVTLKARPQVLMDGIITSIQLSPGRDSRPGTLTVTGEDVSVMMDLAQKNVEHPAQDETAIASVIIASYARYGLVPMVIPPVVVDPPLPIERTPVQRGTDLAYLKEMAARHGYVFYITPGPVPMTNTAYWGPPLRLDIPQPALTVDMGAATNVGSIQFENNALAPELVTGQVQDRQTNQTLPVQTFASTRPPLSAQPAWAANQPNVRRTLFQGSGLNTMQSLGRAQGQTDSSIDGAVTATGALDATRYGALLQARGVVGVRGVGYSYGGLYYVERVRHVIERGEYKQHFTIKRDGTGATVPMVRP